MTSYEILSYLNSDEARKNKFVKLTFVNGETIKVIFNRNDQIKEFADENLWMVVMPDKSARIMEFNGTNLQKIVADNTPVVIEAVGKDRDHKLQMAAAR